MIGHYLLFARCCQDALETYEKAFGADVKEKMTYGQMPPNPAFPIADEDKNLVLHAKLYIGDTELMAADSKEALVAGSNQYITVTTKDEALVKKAWDMLADGGTVYMELAPSFFAVLHGSLRDKYGVNWMFTVSK